VHGACMGRAWGVHGACMGRAWGVHGACMGRAWDQWVGMIAKRHTVSATSAALPKLRTHTSPITVTYQRLSSTSQFDGPTGTLRAADWRMTCRAWTRFAEEQPEPLALAERHGSTQRSTTQSTPDGSQWRANQGVCIIYHLTMKWLRAPWCAGPPPPGMANGNGGADLRVESAAHRSRRSESAARNALGPITTDLLPATHREHKDGVHHGHQYRLCCDRQ
jgi:hypothetical protein